MPFDKLLAEQTALKFCHNQGDEVGLVKAFTEVCSFLDDNPDYLSWRSRTNIPSVQTQQGLEILAEKYFLGFRRSDFPAIPGTIPDEIVSLVMIEAYGYSEVDCNRIKEEHQHAMCAENSVGALLERYLDSVLRKEGWSWCCGSFVKAVDFINRDRDGKWLALQVKNRDNSENSSSSAIRNGTPIQKWHRSFSRSGATNWNNLPASMKPYNLTEDGFRNFVSEYLKKEKAKATKIANLKK